MAQWNFPTVFGRLPRVTFLHTRLHCCRVQYPIRNNRHKFGFVSKLLYMDERSLLPKSDTDRRLCMLERPWHVNFHASFSQQGSELSNVFGGRVEEYEHFLPDEKESASFGARASLGGHSLPFSYRIRGATSLISSPKDKSANVAYDPLTSYGSSHVKGVITWL